jgi:two-component system, LytTR family, sensor kinase
MNNKINDGKLVRILYHLSAWIIYTWFNHILLQVMSPKYDFQVSATIVKFALAAAVFYWSAFFVFPVCINKKGRIWLLIALLPLSILVNFLMRYYVLKYIYPAVVNGLIPPESMYDFFIYSINWWVEYTLFGLAYFLVFHVVKVQKQLRRTEKEKLEAQNKAIETEKEKILANYNFLKAQINPHFLFNTLTWFYAGTRTTNPAVCEGIALLSDLMRYSLKDGGVGDQTSLATEWQQVENYIQLHQLRHNGTLAVQVTRDGPLEGVQLPPHILVTLVENAFKHGDITEARQPIQIHLRTGMGQLQFTVINKINQTDLPPEGEGRGLQNIVQRLRHEYGSTAHFEFEAVNGFFKVNLQLPLVQSPPHPAVTNTKPSTTA